MSILKTMKPAVVERFGAPLVVREVPIPTPGPGQALVEIGNANQADQRGALFGAGWRNGDRENAETPLGHLRIGGRRVTDASYARGARSQRRP